MQKDVKEKFFILFCRGFSFLFPFRLSYIAIRKTYPRVEEKSIRDIKCEI